MRKNKVRCSVCNGSRKVEFVCKPRSKEPLNKVHGLKIDQSKEMIYRCKHCRSECCQVYDEFTEMVEVALEKERKGLNKNVNK